MGRTILIHHHIFKNAGTSFNAALKQYFSKQYLEFDLPNSQVVTQAALDRAILDHPDVLAISSHHACMPTPQGDTYQTVSSVLLRKPLSRIRSIYEFERKQQAQTSGAVKAKELDFKGFVEWRLETAPIVFCNYQTNYCSRLTNQSGHYRPTQADLQTAIENLERCLIVGTVERYDDSLQVANYKLDPFYRDIQLTYRHLNTTSTAMPTDADVRASLANELGETMVTQLEQMNQFDEALYQVAERRLQADLATAVAVNGTLAQ